MKPKYSGKPEQDFSQADPKIEICNPISGQVVAPTGETTDAICGSISQVECQWQQPGPAPALPGVFAGSDDYQRRAGRPSAMGYGRALPAAWFPVLRFSANTDRAPLQGAK